MADEYSDLDNATLEAKVHFILGVTAIIPIIFPSSLRLRLTTKELLCAKRCELAKSSVVMELPPCAEVQLVTIGSVPATLVENRNSSSYQPLLQQEEEKGENR